MLLVRLFLRDDAAGVAVRLRRKTDRWAIPVLPRRRADRAAAVFAMLQAKAPPRMTAAYWHTLWNGWCTRRRMASLHDGQETCCFGCPAGDDSIEHYSNCIFISEFARCRLCLPCAPTPDSCLSDFLALDIANPDSNCDLILRKVLRTAAVYRTHYAVRHATVAPGVPAREALLQAAHQLVRGHRRMTYLLDTSWLAS